MCHMSGVRNQVSGGMCHVSSTNNKEMELVGEGSVINGAYPILFITDFKFIGKVESQTNNF